MKLTEEQQKQVEENHNLIYWYANKYKVNLDEYYDILAIELCNAIMKHDPEKGTLANYFRMRSEGAIYKEYRKTQAQKRIPQGVEFIENVHHIPNVDDMIDELEIKEWLNKENSEILKLRVMGYSQSEIAEKIGMSQNYVCGVLRKLRRKYDETHR